MKRILSVVTLTLVLSGVAIAQTNKKVEDEILKLEKEWFEAYLKSDADAVDRIEADDFTVVTTTSGAFGSKERQVASIRTRDEATRKRLASTTRTLEQAKVRIYENVVVVNGITVSTRRDEPGTTPVVSKRLYTGVWVKRDGRWRIVNAQFTDFPPPKPQSGN